MLTIRLEPLDERHLEDVRALVADPDVLHYTRIPEPAPDDFARSWIAAYETARKDGTREAFAAIGDGRFVGLGLAPTIDRKDSELELGYIVPAWARRGRGDAAALWYRLPSDP